MKQTPALIEGMSDNEMKKKHLKLENKALRDQLKTMSDNVNLLIERMNQETLRKKKYLGPPIGGKDGVSSQGSPHKTPASRLKAAEQEIANTDKAVANLMREHTKLKRRLEEVRNPDYLINLKQ